MGRGCVTGCTSYPTQSGSAYADIPRYQMGGGCGVTHNHSRRAEARGRVGPTPDDLGSKIKIGGGGDGGMGRSGCAVIEKTLRMPYDGSAVGTPSTNGTKACCLLPTPQREKKRELTR